MTDKKSLYVSVYLLAMAAAAAFHVVDCQEFKHIHAATGAGLSVGGEYPRPHRPASPSPIGHQFAFSQSPLVDASTKPALAEVAVVTKDLEAARKAGPFQVGQVLSRSFELLTIGSAGALYQVIQGQELNPADSAACALRDYASVMSQHFKPKLLQSRLTGGSASRIPASPASRPQPEFEQLVSAEILRSECLSSPAFCASLSLRHDIRRSASPAFDSPAASQGGRFDNKRPATATLAQPARSFARVAGIAQDFQLSEPSTLEVDRELRNDAWHQLWFNS